jgi:hypothetical protein
MDPQTKEYHINVIIGSPGSFHSSYTKKNTYYEHLYINDYIHLVSRHVRCLNIRERVVVLLESNNKFVLINLTIKCVQDPLRISRKRLTDGLQDRSC